MKKNVFFIFLSFIFLASSCTSKEKRIEKLMKEGMNKVANSDNKGAITDLTKVIELQPGNHEAYYYRGNAYFSLRNAKEAMTDLSKAIELKPDYAAAYYSRALCEQFMNKKDSACSDWKKAAALGNSDAKDKIRECH